MPMIPKLVRLSEYQVSLATVKSCFLEEKEERGRRGRRKRERKKEEERGAARENTRKKVRKMACLVKH